MVSYLTIVKKSDLPNLKVKFTSEEDPSTKKPVILSFERDNFEFIAEGEELFKLAVKRRIKFVESKKEPVDSQLTTLAVKY